MPVSTRRAGARTAPRPQHPAPPSGGRFRRRHAGCGPRRGGRARRWSRRRSAAPRLRGPRRAPSKSPIAFRSWSTPSPLSAETGYWRARSATDGGPASAGCRAARAAGHRSCSAPRSSACRRPPRSTPSSRSTSSTSARCCSRIGMGDVAHMHDQVGLQHLFEGGAEGGDQMGRQVGDEADRVGDHAAAGRPAA